MGGRIMATTINADTTNGLVLTPDTSGDINLQSAGVTKASITSAGLTVGGSNISPQPTFRNRIINGNMAIHQRGGTITAASATVYYGLDRFWGFAGTGQFSMEQSTDAPDNFLNSMKVTVTTTDASMAAGDRYLLSQPIEGLNVLDLDFGSSTAKTVTLSFWVKSSITGTFGAVLINGNATRTYIKEYTISSANTWEKKTITIAGDTTGTWTYTNALWGSVRFCLATGSTYQGTNDSWNAGNYISTSNQVNLMATNSATFYVTGVQLEVGEQASDFENLQYGTQLSLCQRYLPVVQVANYAATGMCFSATNARCSVQFPVPSRVAPTGFTTTGAISMTANNGGGTGSIVWANASTLMASLSATGLSGLVAGDATVLIGNQSILFTGCEL
jgi:hypothetical protein